MDTIAKLLLAPLLIAQALRVRQKALILPEAAGPRDGIIGAGPDLGLLVVGDSAAAGVGAETQAQALAGQLAAQLSDHHTVRWHLIAQTGATTASTLKRLSQHNGQQFDVVVLSLGVNDVTHGVFLRKWLRQQSELYDLLARQFSAQKIIISGLPPMRHFPLLPQPLRWVIGRQAERFDTRLAAMITARPNCEYVPLDLPFDPQMMAKDGFHPAPPAYARWATLLADRILVVF